MAQATSIDVTVAWVGLDEADRRAVTSAISTLSAAHALPATLVWSDASDADIVVIDIDRDDAPQALDRLVEQAPRSVVRYSGQRAPQADVWRPIRVQGLRDALVRAIEDTLQRPTPIRTMATPAASNLRSRGVALLQRASMTTTASVSPDQQMYRGRPLQTTVLAPPKNPTTAPAEAGAVRMYRGKAY